MNPEPSKTDNQTKSSRKTVYLVARGAAKAEPPPRSIIVEELHRRNRDTLKAAGKQALAQMRTTMDAW